MVAMRTTQTSNPEYRAEVSMIASELAMGETARMSCPRCRGGQSAEKSFICSRNYTGVAFYHCFRATCSFHGKVVLGNDTSVREYKPAKPRAMDYALESLTSSDIDMFRNVYGVNPDRDTFWCPAVRRYAHRVQGPMGEHRGWVLRDYAGTESNKSLSYPFPDIDGPFISWYYPHKELGSGIIVTEDVLSAKKVADSGFKACALLGTWLDFERAYEIADVAERTDFVHLALDEGTVQQMLRYREKFESVFGPAKVWLLREDLKYVSRERIRKAVVDGITNFRIDGKDEGSL